MERKMGRDRYKIYDNSYPHFVTLTLVRWLPLFSQPKIVQICLDSLNYFQQNENFKLYSWVFLENHIHLVVQSPTLGKSLGRFKSFTARKIIDYLKAENQNTVLTDLYWGKIHNKETLDFQLWQEGIHPEQISNREMMIQKITYTHLNPVKRGYVDIDRDWRYSSARNYCGEDGLIPVCTKW